MSTTIVSCYYRIKSKRPHKHYDIYINNLFNNLNPKCQMVIFTSEDLLDYLKTKTNLNNNIKIIVKNFLELPLYIKYLNIWEYQYSLDMQKYTGRGIECYVIWNSKLLFIDEVIDLNPFNSDKFIWMDIGIVRNNDYVNILNKLPVYENISSEKIDIALLNNFSNLSQKFFQDEIHFSGAMYGGGIEPLKKMISLYYNKFDEYILNNKFIGCDQQILSSIYLENINLFNTIIPNNKNFAENNKIIPKKRNIDPWFYIIYFYSFDE